ncbi:MAG TPA: hypothetical protein PL048_01655 [Leptospiraceae bacterium]|nr:hypothetical protein [Leptospiraceae bacterium]
MLYFLQMLQMNFFFLVSAFAAAICVSMEIGAVYSVLTGIALGFLFGYFAMTVDDEKPFKLLENQSDNYSVILSVYLTAVSFIGAVYTVGKFYSYFECDDKALTVSFDQLKVPQKKKFIHLENYYARPVKDLNLYKSNILYQKYQITELLSDSVKQERTNIWLVCEGCSEEEARHLMNGKNAYLRTAAEDLSGFLPQLHADADRSSAIFYILLRGNLEEERNAILWDFYRAAGYANLGFFLIVLILVICRKLGMD